MNSTLRIHPEEPTLNFPVTTLGIPKPSPSGAHGFSTFLATTPRPPILERLALPVVDMSITAVLLCPHNGQNLHQLPAR